MRIPVWTLQLGLMIASAALVVAVGWLGLSLLLSLGAYVETVIP